MVLIIGILAAIAFPKYEAAVLRARLMSFMPLVRSLMDAQERYYMSNGEYAFDMANLDIQIPADCRPRAVGWAPNEILCGTDWLLDNVSGNVLATGHLRVAYCPGQNELGSNGCTQAADVVLDLYYAHHESQGGQKSCIGRTAAGQNWCRSFRTLFN